MTNWRYPYDLEQGESRSWSGEMSKRSVRKITFVGIALGLSFILVSSIYVYGLSTSYTKVYDGPYFDVDLRIDKINPRPPVPTPRPPHLFSLVTCSVKVVSEPGSDIEVHEFSVRAYSQPPEQLGSKKFGESTVYDMLIPAGQTTVFKLKVRVTYWMDFKNANEVWVISYIKWTHFGETYERVDTKFIDIAGWMGLLGG